MEKFDTGALAPQYDIRDYRLNKSQVIAYLNRFPKNFKLSPIFIKNQQDKPTCVAHALSELVQWQHYTAAAEKSKFSTQFIYGMRDQMEYKKQGMHIRDALKVLQKYGDVPYSCLAGNDKVDKAIEIVRKHKESLIPIAQPFRISTYYKITTNDELKYALINHGPVVVNMKTYEGYSLDKRFIYQYDQSKKNSYHAVLVLGWQGDLWYLQNSWGKYWGDKGCFYLPMKNGFSKVFVQAYGVTDNIKDIKISKDFYINKLINKVINTIKS